MPPKPRVIGPWATLLLLPLLAACGGDTSRFLGLTRDAPDEFQVVTRAPLSLPPSLGNLPPPRPGAGRPQELSAREQGRARSPPARPSARARRARPRRGRPRCWRRPAPRPVPRPATRSAAAWMRKPSDSTAPPGTSRTG
ncbi:DUF3035 domain-containing protein [Roseomonas sp. CCTCC AB2023176]|uniref:DUF3035 domain-containing protein n=1 Tax=Roseomonas sp. CCTCC AB2023176 TaxID=3342640 RepID=UPI0035E2B69F